MARCNFVLFCMTSLKLLLMEGQAKECIPRLGVTAVFSGLSCSRPPADDEGMIRIHVSLIGKCVASPCSIERSRQPRQPPSRTKGRSTKSSTTPAPYSMDAGADASYSQVLIT